MNGVLGRLQYLSKGTELRVEHGRRTTHGKFVEVTTDALVVALGDVMERIAASEIVSVAKKVTYAWHGALAGGVIGLGIGFFVAVKALFLTVGFIGMTGSFVIAGIITLMAALFGAAVGAWIPRWKTIWP